MAFRCLLRATRSNAEEAAAAAATIGFPVALKIRSPDITHKTDVGGVALDLPDQASVREAAARCWPASGARSPKPGSTASSCSR